MNVSYDSELTNGPKNGESTTSQHEVSSTEDITKPSSDTDNECSTQRPAVQDPCIRRVVSKVRDHDTDNGCRNIVGGLIAYELKQ